jgi:CheY-like chemotaxis protein
MVLLNIDDDPEDLDIFYKAVKTINPLTKCVLARNAQEALHILRDALVPDYIFLDVHMPMMDGKTVLAELRKITRLKLVPIIMYSSVINPKDMEEYTELGATKFLTKQNSFQELCNALGSVLKVK